MDIKKPRVLSSIFIVLLVFSVSISVAAQVKSKIPPKGVRIEDVKIKAIDFSKVTHLVKISAVNPEKEKAVITSIQLQIKSGSTTLASTKTSTAHSIAAGSSSSLSQAVTLKFNKANEKADSKIKSGKLSCNLTAKVSFKTKSKTWTKSTQYLLSTPILKKPKLKCSDLTIKNPDLTSAKAVTKLHIKNSTSTKLKVEKIKWKIKIGDKKAFDGTEKKETVLDKSESASFKLSDKIDYLKDGKRIIDIARKGKSSYRLTGEIRFQTKYGKISHPFKLKGDVTLGN